MNRQKCRFEVSQLQCRIQITKSVNCMTVKLASRRFVCVRMMRDCHSVLTQLAGL